MSYAIKHLFHIEATKEKIYEAIASVNGLANWWTIAVNGSTEVGGKLHFDFGSFKGPTMEVTELKPNALVAWECVDSEHGWVGNTFRFILDENEGKTRLRFEHNGWEEQGDFYAACNYSWGRYLESLRRYCQSGKGKPFGSSEYNT
jgi:uncharacterized protein YndB with AHSA1/START domain